MSEINNSKYKSWEIFVEVEGIGYVPTVILARSYREASLLANAQYGVVLKKKPKEFKPEMDRK